MWSLLTVPFMIIPKSAGAVTSVSVTGAFSSVALGSAREC